MKHLLTLSLIAVFAIAMATGCEAEEGQSDAIQAAEVEAPEIAQAETGDSAEAAETETPKAEAAPKDDAPQDAPKEEDKQAKPACIVKLVLPSDETSPFLTEENFVMTWTVLGPFNFKSTDFGGDHQQGAVDHEFIKDEAKLDGTQKAPEGTKWQTKTFADGIQAGQVSLEKLYGAPDHAAAYAVTWLDSPEDVKDATLRVGSDDYLKIWINGKLVHTYKKERRGSDWDQDVAKGIELKKGLNHVVVKCVDVVGDYDFYFRLTDKAERPLATQLVKPQPKDKE